MKFLQYKFLAVVAVLSVFVKQSEGNTLASLNESAQIEKLLTSSKFQNLQESMIKSATDKDGVFSRNAIEEIRNDLKKYPSIVTSSEAAGKSVEGILEAIRLVYGIVHQANTAIDAASDLVKAQDIDGANKVITDAFNIDREFIFIAGVPIHDAQGSALKLAGSLALPGLKDAIVSIQKAGGTAFAFLKIASEVILAGIKEGGDAAEEAFKTARSILTTGLLSIYKHAEKATKQALEGIQNALLKTVNKVNLVPGIIDGLKTLNSTDESAALEAIARLSKYLKSVLSVLSKKSSIDLANVIHEGLKSTIVQTANAITSTKKDLEEAGKLTEQNPEAAMDAVDKAIKRGQEKILEASAPGYLGLGVASEMAGKEGSDRLVPFVIEVEMGRVNAFDFLGRAKDVANLGIQGGDEASKQAIQTAIEMCNAAGIALYQDYSDAGVEGFRVIEGI